MIKDLSLAGDGRLECRTRICILGGGTAGIFLAKRLRDLGLSVVVLEAGDRLARRPEEMGHRCVQSGIRYRGAELGRSFGLGGTSVLWGGQMIPLTPADMAARPAVGIDAWPITFDALAEYLPEVKRALGLPNPAEPEEQRLLEHRFPALSTLHADFNLRLSQWLPFGARNFGKAFSEPLQTDPNLEVWLQAGVTRLEWSVEGMDRIVAVEARSPNGRRLIVRPEVVVVCAGALESTRLLLELDEASNGHLTRNGAPIGRYFADHLSVTCGRFHCRDWRRYNLETAPIFEKGVMRTPRLELSSASQQRLAVTSAFAHFTFITHGETGFDVVRNLLRKRQGEQQGLGLSPRLLGRVISDVSAMAYWRGIHRRLWIPRLADLLLQVDIEQVPNWDSRLSLDSERDELGRKRLRIDWRIRPDDVRVIRTVAERTIQAWQCSELREIARLELTLMDQFDTFESAYDVYHPTGSLRMGRRPNDSVVDPDLRVWGLENLYVSSTAVFPSAGSANPGLMHLALTARLAECLARSLNG